MNGFREAFQGYVKDISRGKIKYNGKRIGLSTIGNYTAALHHYEAFCRRFENLYIDEVDLYNFSERRQRVQAKKKSNDHFNSFLSYLQKKGVSVGTQNIYLQKIKTVLKHLENEDMIQINVSNVQAPSHVSEVVIWDNSMTEVLLDAAPKTDAEVLFQLQIHLCCRWSELNSIDGFEIDEIDGKRVHRVNIRQEKTGSRVRPIIPEGIWHLAQAVKSKPKYISDYNNLLRGWLKQFPEFNETITYSKQTPEGRLITYKKKWFDFASSHDLRRAGINRLQVLGVPDNIIRSMYSGHKSAEVFNNHYVGINQEKVSDTAQKIWKS